MPEVAIALGTIFRVAFRFSLLVLKLSGTGALMTVDAEARLSPRELQCLTLLAAGFSNEGIAKEVGIRPPTVAMHLANARTKLKAVTREHAVAIAVSKGLIKI